MSNREQRITKIKDTFGAIPGFPRPPIVFRDIFPVFKDPALRSDLILLLVEHIKEKYEKVDVVAGLDARGFVFGPLIAHHLNTAFVPIRKKGKLPGECAMVEYTYEHGPAALEAQKTAIQPGQKVIIVDDAIATGATMDAACQVVSALGGDILECMVIIELIDMKGAAKLKAPFFSLVTFEGE